jgi:hypothetical protein
MIASRSSIFSMFFSAAKITTICPSIVKIQGILNDNEGQAFIMYAKENGYDTIVAMLKKTDAQ